MKYITSDELGDLARLGLIIQVEFTLNDVYDSWAKEMSQDGLADMNFSEPRHQVVRFVGRAVLIEPVELQVFVVFVRDALEATLRNFDVFVRHV
jgi:hypothetical protein